MPTILTHTLDPLLCCAVLYTGSFIYPIVRPVQQRNSVLAGRSPDKGPAQNTPFTLCCAVLCFTQAVSPIRLYGQYNNATQSWEDGVLTKALRNENGYNATNRAWVVRVRRVGLARNVRVFIHRVCQNHTYIRMYVCTVCIRYFLQADNQTYDHIRCTCTVWANPTYVCMHRIRPYVW